MPGSPTAPGPRALAMRARHVAFHYWNVSAPGIRDFAAQWLACALPCRRFADSPHGSRARLGADVDRYSFTVVDLHHLLFAGLPAHSALRPERTMRLEC